MTPNPKATITLDERWGTTHKFFNNMRLIFYIYNVLTYPKTFSSRWGCLEINDCWQNYRKYPRKCNNFKAKPISNVRLKLKICLNKQMWNILIPHIGMNQSNNAFPCRFLLWICLILNIVRHRIFSKTWSNENKLHLKRYTGCSFETYDLFIS